MLTMTNVAVCTEMIPRLVGDAGTASSGGRFCCKVPG